MFIDIDNFKEVNDRFGHKVGGCVAGDGVENFACRYPQNDTPARLGGDEFVILLPDTPPDEAHVVATQIMNEAAIMPIVQEYAFTCTLSIGIASALPGMHTVSEWLKAADDALYAKRLGKKPNLLALTIARYRLNFMLYIVC